ncbi:AI-2E family transporter [Clostridium sp. SM-530-WT-3G]|uniref:AI-2E family transporter n=1 Tax=Clostridium sp. SM-530-WT-3G TaxID=2725303 RepID=UPI00145F2E5A|nr:AI-2E family transporter [Clostridium sp. SM-530-WT-3G]NME83672.1 AI-2E family transporter [Clostridium sp. SM-530-WT-3G]
MEFKKYKPYLLKAIIAAVFLFCICLYVLNNSVKKVVNIIIVSIILSYVLMPTRRFFERKLKMKRKIASVFIIILLIGIFVSFFVVIIPSLFNEAESINNMIDSIGGFFQGIIDNSIFDKIPILQKIYNTALEKVNGFIYNYLNNFVDILINVSSNLISYAICPVMIYYLLGEGEEIYEKLMLIFPISKRKITKRIISDIDMVLSRYIASQLLLCGIIGLLTFILLIILKVKFPIWISLINALFNIIPYFGPILGIIPAAVVALIDSPIKCLWVVIGMFIIQQIEGNILSPKITGDSTEIHSFVIIILLLIGDELGGFVGMVLVIPIAVIIKVLYEDINYYLF